MTIKAKFKGNCKLCGATWNVDDAVHYSKTPKAICTDEECFKTQMSNANSSGRESSFSKTITTVKPDVEVPSYMTEAMEKVVQGIAASHDVVKILYPDLDENTHTFGQIRSKLVDQLFTALNTKIE